MFNYEKQRPLHEYTIFLDEKPGKIAVYEEGIVIRTGKADTPVRFSYIQSVSKRSTVPVLGKVDCQIIYFSLFGNQETVNAKMRENDIAALKKDTGK